MDGVLLYTPLPTPINSLIFFATTHRTRRACWATIDGVPVSDLAAYRVESPLFEFTLPEDNLFAFFGLDAPAGTTSPAVDAGYYLLLKLLPPGLHTIHIESAFDELGVIFNNTFNITVE